MIVVANHSDHARIRKLVSHAFSETALREQETILISYFDLLVSRLQEQIDGPTGGKVDIMSWYNFTTFDIIGFVDTSLVEMIRQRNILTRVVEIWPLVTPSMLFRTVIITSG